MCGGPGGSHLQLRRSPKCSYLPTTTYHLPLTTYHIPHTTCHCHCHCHRHRQPPGFQVLVSDSRLYRSIESALDLLVSRPTLSPDSSLDSFDRDAHLFFSLWKNPPICRVVDLRPPRRRQVRSPSAPRAATRDNRVPLLLPPLPVTCRTGQSRPDAAVFCPLTPASA